MEPVPPGLPPAGFFLSLLTESFAVRALFGSLVAGGLAAGALRSRRVQSPRARRLVVLAPLVAAAAAATASLVAAEAYLPQLWIAAPGGSSGPALELLGELRVISNARGVDVLFLGWALTAAVLLSRRAWGLAATRRLLRAAVPAAPDAPLRRRVRCLTVAMRVRDVEVRLLERCPGGALAAGIRRPVVVLDARLLGSLDPQELEGLLAHEIAHVARRDALLSLVVGVLCDLTFFLPPVHLVGRWLHREREESADELASTHTRRPAALASGILKVFEGAAPRSTPLSACAAVPGAIALGGRRGPGLSDGALVVAERVERLVSGSRGRSAARQVAEVSVAAVLIVAASAATLVVPPWIATELDAYSLAIGYVPPPAQTVESPAFATFRALAPFAGATEELRGYERTFAPGAPVAAERIGTCPCVESQAQWLAGVPATGPAPDPTMTWRRTASPTWAVRPGVGSVRARPLLTLRETGPQVGFFVVGESQTAP